MRHHRLSMEPLEARCMLAADVAGPIPLTSQELSPSIPAAVDVANAPTGLTGCGRGTDAAMPRFIYGFSDVACENLKDAAHPPSLVPPVPPVPLPSTDGGHLLTTDPNAVDQAVALLAATTTDLSRPHAKPEQEASDGDAEGACSTLLFGEDRLGFAADAAFYEAELSSDVEGGVRVVIAQREPDYDSPSALTGAPSDNASTVNAPLTNILSSGPLILK